jgi:hypothetical protein
VGASPDAGLCGIALWVALGPDPRIFTALAQACESENSPIAMKARRRNSHVG